MIKTIVFDYGGVLTKESAWDPVVWGYFNNDKIKATPVIEVAVSVWEKARLGNYNSKEFWEVIAEAAQQEPEKVKSDILSFFALDTDMINLTKALKEKYRLVILSNQLEDWLETVVKDEALDQIFDNIIGSYHAGAAKPDTEIFEYMKTKLNLNLDECLFIDDTKKNVDVAESLGMAGIVFSNYTQLLLELKKFNII